jgi:tetratricopeptide (TPR) repeat protein
MDLGKWTDAIEDFKLSLSVNPKSLLAEFSIGECFFKMGDYKNAIKQFQKAIDIDPAHQAPRDFLKKAIDLDNEKK